MFRIGDVISHLEMSQEEGAHLQRGMNFRLRPGRSIVLMSRRRDAPYDDAVKDEGRTIIYEGHDVPRTKAVPEPKLVDQPAYSPSGRKLTQNGLFERAALEYKSGLHAPEQVRVYEKLHPGIWVFNGTFALTAANRVREHGRMVFKFRLELLPDEPVADDEPARTIRDLPHARVIPSSVKLAVWKRDNGRCVKCGAKDNLHFDHVLPYSRGGASITAENVQILCARHNLEKGARIE